MKIARIRLQNGEVHHASVRDETGDSMELLSGNPFDGLTSTGEIVTSYSVLAPVVPTSILCVGLNYRKHAEETGARIPEYPVLFFKNPSAILDPGAAIRLPRKLSSTQVDYEGELALVIGKDCKNASRADALEYVMGYTCANDVSARDWQKQWGGSQWCRGKSFDSFAPLGPWLVTPDEIPDPNALQITTRVNGEVLQYSNTSDMIFDVCILIEFLSADTTLLAGTVILTGTPEGVGMSRKPPRWLQSGDLCSIQIESIGILQNTVH